MSKEEVFLSHYGIPGMRWGRRKSSSGEGYEKSGKAPKGSTDHQESREIQKKSVASMTNADLKKVNARLQLEQQYSQLNPVVVKSGKKTVDNILSYVDTATKIYGIVNGPMVKDGRAFLKSKK